MSRDPEYVSLINSWRWQKMRRLAIIKHPLCECCLAMGHVRPADEVHHKRPIGTGRTFEEKQRLAYDEDNLMCLCHDCHAAMHEKHGYPTKAECVEKKRKEVKQAIDLLYNDDNGGIQGTTDELQD